MRVAEVNRWVERLLYGPRADPTQEVELLPALSLVPEPWPLERLLPYDRAVGLSLM